MSTASVPRRMGARPPGRPTRFGADAPAHWHVDDALDEDGRAGAAAEEKLEGALAGLEERPAAMAGPVKPLAEGSGSVEPAATPTANCHRRRYRGGRGEHHARRRCA